MDGTTLCPHCDTRFKIKLTQLEAHHGMVRCGSCLRPFDARVSFVSEVQHPQLELAILDVVAAPASPAATEVERDSASTLRHAESPTAENLDFTHFLLPEPDNQQTVTLPDGDYPATTLAEQVLVTTGEATPRSRKKSLPLWLWFVFVLLALLLLVGQLAYFFRADLAARVPGTQAMLRTYCQLLGCSVNLPQKNDLMSIESSSLEADPSNAKLVTLAALLRNRATYPLAFPNLQLTLNDKQDKPVARRIFKPADYLPASENEKTGLLADHEVSLKLSLDTADLEPSGYRLMVFYSPSH